MIVNCILVKSEKVIEDLGEIVSFGLSCYNVLNPSELSLIINDISSDPNFVYELTKKINFGQTSDMHIMDIVYDYIAC